ncbi:unnamed protein product [Ilex paraguariensis]|uniref:Sialate O-acetylesterase domain-containing protein n=1 Tax=Ilex paraguariensis TaxID=185542 RepID=A0ABC8QRP5_9AQUA
MTPSSLPLFFTVVLANVVFGRPSQTPSLSTPGANVVAKDIFILAGQSNMAGRGGVHGGKWDGNIPPGCKPHPSILRFSAKHKWEVAKEPLHADIDVKKICGIGPGMPFANEVLANVSKTRVVGLVPCAIGGTRMTKWARGTPLYARLVHRANESLREGGAIRGLLWFHGESDTESRIDAEAYKDRMETFINDLRSDLNVPNLPVIQVVTPSGDKKFMDTVRRAQKEVNLPDVWWVDARGLNMKSDDHMHLTTISQVHLGRNMARVFLASYGPSSPHT